MKAGFSLSKRFVPKWRGNDALSADNQFVAILSMPEVEDHFAILDRLSAAEKAGKEVEKNEDGTPKLDMKRAMTLAAEAGHMIPKYVKFENAEDFTVEHVIKYPPYFLLAAELLYALVAFAQPNEDDVKN